MVVVTLSDVLGAPTSENLTARAGEEITLQTGLTGLHGDYLVLWYTSKETLVQCHKGEIDINPPERFKGRLHLNTTTGCLRIQDLSIQDNGVYKGEIIDLNNKKTVHHYTIIVLEPAPTQPPARSSNNLTDEQKRRHLAVGLSLGGLGLVAVVIGLIVYALCIKKGKCCSSDVV